jgi:two-component system cell cycle response regulator
MAARILVIEDNHANLELMVYLLKAFGYTPLTATQGDVGLDIARRDKPDLIICDIQMPGMDGYAVAKLLKENQHLASVPLVAVTAYAMVGDREKVLAAGFDGYLSKPIDPQTFVATVESFIPRSLRVGAAAPPPPAAPAAERQRQTILVVDDQPMNRSLKQSLLEPLGYAVLTAEGMQRGLELARKNRPDLIVSDVEMGQGSGFEFIEQVKSDPQLRDVPFIFITSTHWDIAWRDRGLALGAARFLFRPLEPEQLLQEIKACLRKR